MCKILVIPSIKDERREQTTKFILKMADKLSLYNTDGLGYAAIDSDGELFAERWLDNNKAFSSSSLHDETLYNILGPATKSKYGYTSYGVPDLNKAKAITLHTRMATSSKGITNCHPFIKDDTSVIHNGIIHNHDDFDLTLSTCDSEAILVSYLDNNVGHNSIDIKDMAHDLIGYYACGIFSRDIDGYRILDVFKGNNASLYCSFINELDTYVFSTSGSDITSACKDLGYTHNTIFEIDEGILLRLDPFTGDVISHTPFKVGDSYKNTNTYSRSHDKSYAKNDEWTEYSNLQGKMNLISEADWRNKYREV